MRTGGEWDWTEERAGVTEWMRGRAETAAAAPPERISVSASAGR